MRKLLLLASSAAVVLIILLGELPWNTLLGQALQNALHVPASAVLYLLLRALLLEFAAVRRRPIWWVDIGALLLCVALGAAIEAVQLFLGRDAELQDILHDALGGILALSLLLAIRSKHGGQRTIAVVIALAATIWALTPLTQSLLAYRYRNTALPDIAEFQSPRSEYFLQSRQPGLMRVRVPPPYAKSPEEMALHVPLLVDPWPGVLFIEPYPDWRGHRSVSIELINPSDEELTLNVRIHDRLHNQDFDDRFNTRLQLPARQRRTFEIPLSLIATAPRTRAMDMANIAMVGVFADQAHHSQSFYLCHLRLR